MCCFCAIPIIPQGGWWIRCCGSGLWSSADGRGHGCLWMNAFWIYRTRGGKHRSSPICWTGPGLFLLKAFTKSYAMAGLRLGYGISADRALLAQMSRMVQAWNVSLPAQKAGEAALGEDAYLAEARKLIVQERAYLERALREYLGARICPSQANYMLFYCDRPLYEALLEQGILIRRCANYPGLGQGWYRIAVKRPEENRLLVAALRRIAEEE